MTERNGSSPPAVSPSAVRPPAGARPAAALSENTKRAYASDWCAFCSWCEAGGVVALPAEPGAIADHLASLAGMLGRSGLRRRLAAIAHHHRRAGHPWETRHPTIGATMHGILASHGKPARPAAALTSAEVRRLLANCGSDVAGLRDRALLLVGFAGGLRRSELVAIDREHLRFVADGMTVLRPSAGRDQEGEGATIGIPRGSDPLSCPVRAVEAWLGRSRIEWGPLFRRLSAGGSLEDRLSPQGVWRILRRRAEMANLTVDAGERLSPHGLRAGFIAEACRKGVPDASVLPHRRQQSVAASRRDLPRAQITSDSPARRLDR